MPKGNNHTQARIREAYTASPNRCRHCDEPILPRPGVKLAYTRRQVFCSKSCAAKLNNRADVAPKKLRRPRVCGACGGEFYDKHSNRRLCDPCLESLRLAVPTRTKAEAGHRVIRAHAVTVAKGSGSACQRCGYSFFVDVCHVRPVGDFPSSATVAEINDPANLLKLCPNCHHEFDAGMFSVSDLKCPG